MTREVGVWNERRGLPGRDRVLENAFGGADVRNWTRARIPNEAIVFDQAVVGPAGECEDRQLERVECRHLEQGRVGGAFLYRGTVKAVEVVANKDVVGATPVDEIAKSGCKVRSPLAFPDAFLVFPAGGHRVEDAVVAEFDIYIEKGQIDPRESVLVRNWINCSDSTPDDADGRRRAPAVGTRGLTLQSVEPARGQSVTSRTTKTSQRIGRRKAGSTGRAGSLPGVGGLEGRR